MAKTDPPRYKPPQTGTRGTWDEPTPAEIRNNFDNYPEIVPVTKIADTPLETTNAPPIHHEPVPVYMVNPSLPTQAVVSFITQQYSILPALGKGQQVASRRPNRTKLMIVNITAGKTVYVGDTADVSDTHDGYPLMPATGNADGLSMTHQREVYVYNPDATTAVVLALYSEYSTEIR
jgi:hypothetical protein